MLQNFYDNRMEYFNMDTTSSVLRGRWDQPPEIEKAFREKKYLPIDFTDSLYEVYAPKNTDRPYRPVFRDSISMPELTISNKKINRALRKAVRIHKKKRVAHLPYEYSIDDWKTTVVVPDTSGFFIKLELEYSDKIKEYRTRITVIPNYFMYNATIYSFYRLRESTSDLFEDSFIGCLYYDDMLCIVSLNDSETRSSKDLFFRNKENKINIHLYQTELQVTGLIFWPYIKTILR